MAELALGTGSSASLRLSENAQKGAQCWIVGQDVVQVKAKANKRSQQPLHSSNSPPPLRQDSLSSFSRHLPSAFPACAVGVRLGQGWRYQRVYCSRITLTSWVSCDQAPALCKVSSPDLQAEPCGWEAESFPELQTDSCRAAPIPGQSHEDVFFLFVFAALVLEPRDLCMLGST